jgi:pimeloyl-ACP methyl ester carboxylesterase
MTPRHEMVSVRGFQMHTVEMDGPEGDGDPLILLHGWPEFWATWEPVMQRLGGRYRLIAPDLRGFGESENPNPEPSDQVGPAAHAADLIALMDAMGLDRVGLVGHDVGAFVMQRLALDHPDRFSGLMFFNCATAHVGRRWLEPRMVNEIWYQTFHQMPFAAALLTANRDACRAHIGHILKHWCHRKDAFDAVLERWVDNFMRPGVMQGGFNWYISQNAARLAMMAETAPLPPKITVPARVVWGRHDPVLRSDWADVLPKAFEDVSVDFAEECGHFVHYEDPDLAAREIDAFFSEIFRANVSR